jgi:hypothetical protein
VDMASFTVAHRTFQLTPARIETCMAERVPEPVREHYVIVAGRRYPPTQVLACVTGLPRAEFTSHHARSVLRRLGFACAHRAVFAVDADALEGRFYGERIDPDGSGDRERAAAALAPFVGQWVALDSPTDVIAADDSLRDLAAWLSRYNRKPRYGVFRVPRNADEVQGALAS